MQAALVSSLVLGAITAALPAQCTTVGTTLPGVNGIVRGSLHWDPDGPGPAPSLLVVVGEFTQAGGLVANGVAAWEPQSGTWSVFGSGLGGIGSQVVELPGGGFAVGGFFSSAGGIAANQIARWTGTAWTPLGTGVTGGVASMAVTAAGELAVSCHIGSLQFQVSLWNGASWTQTGSFPGYPRVVLAIAANGDLLAGHAGGVSRWDGSAWSPYAPGIANVDIIATTPNVQLFAGGQVLSQDRNFAIWNGATWTTLGLPYAFPFGHFIADVDFLPNGDPVVSGIFGFIVPPISAPLHLTRWNGSTWVGLSSGTTGTNTATFLPHGELVAGVGASGFLARFVPTCAAQQTAAGAGCPSSGGANSLAVETLPWIGGTFRARGTGLPLLSIVTEIYGFSTISLPLSLVLPQGQPGCNLLVSPDFVNFSLPVAGATTTVLPIPDAVSLVGFVFHHQLNAFEFDTAGNIVALTASNALSLTMGAF